MEGDRSTRTRLREGRDVVDHADDRVSAGRGVVGEEDERLPDLVHQTAMYYEDRLSGTGFSRVVLAGAGASAAQPGQDADYLRRALEQRLGTTVDAVDPRNAATLTDRITANSELLDALAPLVGLLARERAA